MDEHENCVDYGKYNSKQNPFCHEKLCDICKEIILPVFPHKYNGNNYCLMCGYVECSICKDDDFELCKICEYIIKYYNYKSYEFIIDDKKQLATIINVYVKNKKIILNLKVSDKIVEVIDNFIPYVVYTELQ